MTNTSIHQNDNQVKTRMLYRILNHGRIEHYLAQEILLDTDELAQDVLAVNGFTTPFDDGFVKDEKVWKFYGVTEKYFNGILSRNYISNRALPECVHRERGAAYVTLSPRITLALCAIMYAGRNIPEDSRVMQVYKNLKGTRYYARAEERLNEVRKVQVEELNKQKAAKSIIEHVFDDESEFVQINSQGKVEISIASLAKLVGYMSGTPAPIAEVKPDESKMQESKVNPAKTNKGGNRNNGWKRRKVILFDKGGDKREFESVADCGRFIGVTSGMVTSACTRNGPVHGYKVVYA